MIMLVPVREFVLPGGETKYQCTRCWGVYNTQEQAERIDSMSSNGRIKSHRCKARPLGKTDRSRRLEATTSPGLRQGPYGSGALPDTGESGETYDAEMASLHNSKRENKDV